jgi:hypothetical protein
MKTEQQVNPPTQQEIAAYAYQLWESEGRQQGREWHYWFQAETQLTADRKQDAAIAAAAVQATVKLPEVKPVATPKAPAPSAPVAAPIASPAATVKPVSTPQKGKKNRKKK